MDNQKEIERDATVKEKLISTHQDDCIQLQISSFMILTFQLNSKLAVEVCNFDKVFSLLDRICV